MALLALTAPATERKQHPAREIADAVEDRLAATGFLVEALSDLSRAKEDRLEVATVVSLCEAISRSITDTIDEAREAAEAAEDYRPAQILPMPNLPRDEIERRFHNLLAQSNDIHDAHWKIELGFQETVGLARALEAMASSAKAIDPASVLAICAHIRADYDKIRDQFQKIDELSEERSPIGDR